MPTRNRDGHRRLYGRSVDAGFVCKGCLEMRDDMLNRAEEVRAVADKATTPDAKAELKQLAKMWERMAYWAKPQSVDGATRRDPEV
jgi:hypothetical protein